MSDVDPKARVRRAIVVLIAALVVWTAVSFWMLATIRHAPCVPFVVIGPGGVRLRRTPRWPPVSGRVFLGMWSISPFLFLAIY